ncbi:DUF116 domain-containing protein [Clostridium kluyveri]|uniref:DUF116 domain-containing protein n=1 Tax=Clostridium kluyveri TaxID=1534 RepID=UPI002245629B|nr:DUF116 domain-containing protein [Clostridium kluyveri]UZQ51944.1 DUF116 domain-containing protein [Clostridium kluyveri]
MKNYITYNLRDKLKHSDEYYKFMPDFSEQVIQKIKIRTNNIIEDFMAYIIEFDIEQLRSREEYQLEILIMGVLWNVYSEKSLDLPKIPGKTLSLLSSMRQYSWIFKKCIDSIKGKMAYKYLLKGKINRDLVYNTHCIENDFEKLIIWLKCTGEFKFQAGRMEIWNLFFKHNNKEYVRNAGKLIVEIADWFEKESMEKLGKYTLNVKKFLMNEYKFYGTREDNIFCGRREIEYHLNMVGAEILNRVFRNTFLKTEDKIIFLPACMCLKPYSTCRRKKTDKGFICMRCSENCKVNILNRIGKKYNFKVYIVPHESNAFSGRKHIRYGDIGIVGIACVLNLIEGGLKARNLNLVPQCVILDYCGCKNHWHKSGIETDINYRKLFEILQISQGDIIVRNLKQ